PLRPREFPRRLVLARVPARRCPYRHRRFQLQLPTEQGTRRFRDIHWMQERLPAGSAQPLRRGVFWLFFAVFLSPPRRIGAPWRGVGPSVSSASIAVSSSTASSCGEASP